VAATVEPGPQLFVFDEDQRFLEGYSAWGVSERHRVLLFLAAFAAHASRIAVTTGQQEKLDALRNAVLNAAFPSGDIDADTQAIFLRHIGDLTPSHLHMLKLLVDVSSSDTSTDDMVLLYQHRAKFQTARARGFYEQLDRDLSAAGLIYQGIIWDALRRAGEHPPR
jgi:hypothetical protein